MLRRCLALATLVLPLVGLAVFAPSDAWAAHPAKTAHHAAGHHGAATPAKHHGKSHAAAKHHGKHHGKAHHSAKHRKLAKGHHAKRSATAHGKTAFHHRGRVHKRQPTGTSTADRGLPSP